MMIIGSAVRPFPELQSYDRAFFNYFCPVELEPLTEEQAYRILKRHAKWDRNTDFEEQHRKHRGKIRAISLLTGGNPRLLLMLYEILTHQNVQSAVQALRRLVDELTPLLKDILEHQLTKQQVKVVDALMQLDGNATPSQLAGKSKLSLNIVTSQLKRLEEARIVEVAGGGKGRPAWYSIRDRLFYTWYEMRYLQPGRRRIELFVQVLQIWFEADERMQRLHDLCATAKLCDKAQVAASAEAAEYFAVSLMKTQHEKLARRMAIKARLRAGQPELAVSLFSEFNAVVLRRKNTGAGYASLTQWLCDHGDLQEAISLARERVRENPEDAELLFTYGLALGLSGKNAESLSCFDQVVDCPRAEPAHRAAAFVNRGVAKHEEGDDGGAIADFTAAIELQGASPECVAEALHNRGVIRGRQGDAIGEIADYTAAIELQGASPEQIAEQLCSRGVTKGELGDRVGEIADYTAAIELQGAPPELIAEALCNRGITKGELGDTAGEIADYTAVVELQDAPPDSIAKALSNRGVAKWKRGDAAGGIADYTAVVGLQDAPPDGIARALINRGVAQKMQGDTDAAIKDYTAVVSLRGTRPDLTAMALYNRGIARVSQGDRHDATTDFIAVAGTPEGPPNIRITAGAMAILGTLAEGDESAAHRTATALREWLMGLASNERTRHAVECLVALADLEARDAWLYVFRELLKDLPAETLKELAFLKPAAEVLETGDMSKLDALAPEQRDFALHVLGKLGQNKPQDA